MKDDAVEGTAHAQQARDVLSILMDSDFYLDLPLQERQVLLHYLVNTYCALDVSSS